jgi:hypothetical protein
MALPRHRRVVLEGRFTPALLSQVVLAPVAPHHFKHAATSRAKPVILAMAWAGWDIVEITPISMEGQWG